MVFILKNPLSSGAGEENLNEKIRSCPEFEGKTFEENDITKMTDMVAFLKGLAPEDEVVIVGGDGTLNHLANDIRGYHPVNNIYTYAAGNGNDYVRDVRKPDEAEKKLFRINDDIVDLPVVVIDGKAYSFLNNVAYGIDGEVCVVGEDQKAAGNTDVNYTSIAIKLMFKYKPCDVHYVVDGKSYDFKKAWLSPVMNGKFYGGGMMITPNQDRKTGKISSTVFYGSGKIRTLMIFPKIFSGEHVKYVKNITMLEGEEMEVSTSEPKHVHIDGEVVRDVTSMHAYKGAKAHEFDLYTPEGEKK